MKYICTVCGFLQEGPYPPEFSPQCKAPASKFIEAADTRLNRAAEHELQR